MKIILKNIFISIIATLFLAGCMQAPEVDEEGFASYTKEQNGDVVETIVLYYKGNKVEKVEIDSKLYYVDMEVNSKSEAEKSFTQLIESMELIDGIELSMVELQEKYLLQNMSIDFKIIEKTTVEDMFGDDFFVYDKNNNVIYAKTIIKLEKSGYKKLR